MHEIVIFWCNSKIRFIREPKLIVYLLTVVWWHYGATKIWVSIVSGNVLLPDRTKITWTNVDLSLVSLYAIPHMRTISRRVAKLISRIMILKSIL